MCEEFADTKFQWKDRVAEEAQVVPKLTKLTIMKETKPETSPCRCSIEARAYDILGLAAHDFWVLRDEGNYVLGQLHGLATNHKNEILPIGRVGDKLKFYHFGARATLLGLKPEHDFNFIKPDQKSMVVFAGNADDVLARWDNAVKALPYLNSLELPYTPFGILGLMPINSNTAYTLLGKLMGIRGHIFRGYWQPGWRNAHKILTASQLETMGYPQDVSDSDSA